MEVHPPLGSPYFEYAPLTRCCNWLFPYPINQVAYTCRLGLVSRIFSSHCGFVHWIIMKLLVTGTKCFLALFSDSLAPIT